MGRTKYDTPEAALEAKRKVNREAQQRCREKKAATVRHFGDLTEAEIIEIVNLVFPFEKADKTPLAIDHFDGCFGQYTDLREAVTTVTFDALIRYHIPEKPIDNVIIRILPTLDVYIQYKYEGQAMFHTNPLPVRNQYRIQQKFVDWKICPQFVFD